MKHRYLLISLAAALVFTAAAFAQREVTDAEIDASIQVLKDTANPEMNAESGFRNSLTRARMMLGRNPEKSLDKLTLLLDENIVQIRLNAVIVLAEMAQKGNNDPKLTEQLQRCMGDSSIAIVYWALMGLTSDDMPDDARREAVAQCLTETKPETLSKTQSF